MRRFSALTCKLTRGSSVQYFIISKSEDVKVTYKTKINVLHKCDTLVNLASLEMTSRERTLQNCYTKRKFILMIMVPYILVIYVQLKVQLDLLIMYSLFLSISLLYMFRVLLHPSSGPPTVAYSHRCV
jgi:hypothetical protein